MKMIGMMLLLDEKDWIALNELQERKNIKEGNGQSIQTLFEKAANRVGLYLVASGQRIRKPSVKEIFLQEMRKAGLNPIRLGADILKSKRLPFHKVFEQVMNEGGLYLTTAKPKKSLPIRRRIKRTRRK